MQARSASIVANLGVGLTLALTAAPSGATHAPSEMQAWATWVEEVVRGPNDVAEPHSGLAFWGEESFVLGEASGDVLMTLSLGDGGWVTLGFDEPIGDGPGADFAVFENVISDNEEGFFIELAFVEVSSNGVDFARFAAESDQPGPVPGGGVLLPELFYNLAGVDLAGWGTGFDLAELADHPLVVAGELDLQDVAYVRLVDVIGNGSTFDADGNPVYDPYPTNYTNGSGGFDLDSVGVLNVPEPAGMLLLACGLPLLATLRGRRRRTAVARGSRLAAIATAGLLVSGLASTAHALNVVDFEDLGLAPESHWNGSDESGGFTSRGVHFQNSYLPDPDFPYWYGFAHSTMTDTTTPGFANQYSAIPGSGAGGSPTYGVFFDDAFEDPRLVLPTSEVVEGFYASNTTYAYLSMLNGDDFAKKFGGDDGTDEDWLLLTISAYDDVGDFAGSVELYLADFTSPDSSADYILDDWSWVDLGGLGPIKELGFEITSSDTHPTFGFINTPTYFAMDDLRIVPEPGTALLVGLGLLGIGLSRRR